MAVDMYKKTSLMPKRLWEKIRRLTGVRYAVSHIGKMLRSFGFSKKIPNPVHMNANSNHQCARRYEETMDLVSRMKGHDFTIIAQDESFVNDVARGYKLWAPEPRSTGGISGGYVSEDSSCASTAPRTISPAETAPPR